MGRRRVSNFLNAGSPRGRASVPARVGLALVLLAAATGAQRTFPWRDFFLQGVGEGERGACFPLRKRPFDVDGDGFIYDADLAVAVDDAYVPSTVDGETAWHYDPAPNALCFEDRYVPAEGLDLVVEYFITYEELMR
jgi:hypothetical protein